MTNVDICTQMDLFAWTGPAAPGAERAATAVQVPVYESLSNAEIEKVGRLVRTQVLEVIHQDYVRTARAKGVSEARVLIRHALANAGIPVLTVIGISLALLLSGVVVTESVYAIPGLGRLMVDAVLARDFPTIQGVVLFFSGLYVFLNLVIDLSYVFVDPRIRY